MPSLSEEILLMVEAGIYYTINPYALFRLGLPYNPSSLYKAVERLRKNGLIKKETKKRRIFLRLTEEGKRVVREHRESAQDAPAHWDGKWRLVIFDIPEKRSVERRYLRDYIKTLGFSKVQRSVWISPFDFAPGVERFARKFNLSEYIFQLTVTEFRNLSPEDTARTFWRIEQLHTRYLHLIKNYSQKLAQAGKITPTSPETASISRKILMNSLFWDYQAILLKDPQLPDQILPPDWGGKTARAFVEKCRAAILNAKI